MAPMDFGVSAIREGDLLYIQHDRYRAAARVGHGRGTRGMSGRLA